MCTCVFDHHLRIRNIKKNKLTFSLTLKNNLILHEFTKNLDPIQRPQTHKQNCEEILIFKKNSASGVWCIL